MTTIMTKPQRLHRRNAQDRLVAVLHVITDRWLHAEEWKNEAEMLRLQRRYHRLIVERHRRVDFNA